MRGRGLLLVVLSSTMVASTFMLTVFGVLAPDLIETFDVERWQVGALVTASSAGAGVVSPTVGRLVDRAGARASTVATLAGGTLALAAVAGAPTYLLLVVAALATALPQAMANPATNKLISEQVPPGVRGTVTGVKQSGVQIGVFAGGLALPTLAAVAGWRAAVLVFVVLLAAATALAASTLPPDLPPTTDRGGPGGLRAVGASLEPDPAADRRLPPLVRRLTVYGFLLGAGGTTLFTYVPLYAEEALGTSARTAGAVVALTGLVGIGARIAWGRAAELQLGALRSLRVIAVLAVLAPLLLVAASATTVLLWPVAVVTGVSASAWNAVGMLAIIQGLPARDTGRASGLVMFGFLAGLGLGAPAFGWSVDLTGSYTAGWLAASALFAAALAVLATAREPGGSLHAAST